MPSRSPSVVLVVAFMPVALTLALALLPATALAATEARSSSRAEDVLAQLVNDRRDEAGLPALTTRSDLHDIARDWSFAQAERREMGHNPDLAGQTCCWTKIAENVARSGGHDADRAEAIARALLQLWRDSPGHDDTMTDPDVDQLGVGVVIDGDGTAWGTTVFRACDGARCSGGSQGPAGDTSVSWAPPPESEPEPEPTASPEPTAPPEPDPPAATASEPPPAPEADPPVPAHDATPSVSLAGEPRPSPGRAPAPSRDPALVAASLRGEPGEPTGSESWAVLAAGLAVAAAVAAARRRT